MSDQVLIVGASHAGISCAEQLRTLGFDGDITVVDQQTGAPLERPPLSKAYLGSTPAEDDKFLLRRADWYDKFQVTMRAGAKVVGCDPASRQVQLEGGENLAYDKLVIATGAVPRQLPDTGDLSGVFVVRSPDDARKLRGAMTATKTAADKTAIVIGGGYIGLEVAASCAKAGLEVHVIEAADRLLARVASPDMSAFFAALHMDHGVQMHIGVQTTKIHSKDGAFAGVSLSDGQFIAAGLLVVGIGVVPDMTLATAAGITTGNGILVDQQMRTSAGDIYAIGDVALVDGAALRIESVHNAQFTAARAAAAITGTAMPADMVPWFWSEQYDVRLQSAGIVPVAGTALSHVVRPGKRAGGLSVWSYQAGRLVAVEAVRDPAAYVLGKKCLESNLSPPPSDIVDSDFDLKSFVSV
jgi:NADPH-dependent 2,4-dienoyl-CoA reductase/sulfur reductase-like enzyme